MIVLKPGTNYVSFTLVEKYDFYTPSVSSYPDLYFTFKIKNELNENEIYFTSNFDISLLPNRLNTFNIKVETSPTASVDPYNAEIILSGLNEDYLSQWNYEVWGCQGPMPTSGTISITGTASLLETGKMLFTK